MKGIGGKHAALKQKILDGALNPVRALVPQALVEDLCRTCGHAWRERLMNPLLTVLACVYKQMEPGTSARAVEDWMAGLSGVANTARDGKTFCDARTRLMVRVLQLLARHVGAAASRQGCYRLGKWSVSFVDGSTCKVPGTEANTAAFGVPANQHGVAGLPVLRLVLLACAGSGAVLDCAFGPNRLGELRLCVQMLGRLPPDGLVVGDALFGSYLNCALLRQRGCQGLFYFPAARKDTQRARLGRGDTLPLWHQPQHPRGLFPHLQAALPETLVVRVIERMVYRRGYRPWRVKICTTLLDPKLYPADLLVEVYLQRWNIEVDLRTLKTLHGLDALTAKTPAVVVRELYSSLLAYNLVRALMAQTGVPVRDLSYTRARDQLVDACSKMSEAPTARLPCLFQLLLELIGTATQEPQARGPEPRAIVDNQRRYPLLRISRAQWRIAHAA